MVEFHTLDFSAAGVQSFQCNCVGSVRCKGSFSFLEIVVLCNWHIFTFWFTVAFLLLWYF